MPNYHLPADSEVLNQAFAHITFIRSHTSGEEMYSIHRTRP